MSHFISSYETRPLLWNVKHSEYYNRVKRQQKLEEIAEMYKLSGKNIFTFYLCMHVH